MSAMNIVRKKVVSRAWRIDSEETARAVAKELNLDRFAIEYVNLENQPSKTLIKFVRTSPHFDGPWVEVRLELGDWLIEKHYIDVPTIQYDSMSDDVFNEFYEEVTE